MQINIAPLDEAAEDFEAANETAVREAFDEISLGATDIEHRAVFEVAATVEESESDDGSDDESVESVGSVRVDAASTRQAVLDYAGEQ